MSAKFENIKRQIYSIVSATIVFLLFFMLFLNNVLSVKNDFNNRAVAELDAMTDIIEYKLNKELSNVKILEVFIKESIEKHGEIETERLNMYAAYILDSSEYVDNITISPEGIIQYIVPMEGNEMMLGYNLLNEKTRSEFLERAIESKSEVAQGPVITTQGKRIVFNRLPIFIPENGKEVFWGIASVSIDFERFIIGLEIEKETDLFDFVIYASSVDGDNDFFWGDKSILDKEYIGEKINLPQLTWQMAMYPKKGWYQYVYLDLPYFFIGMILAVFVFCFVRKKQIKHWEVKQQAKTDSLTGCNNRLEFDRMLKNQTIIEKNSALMIVDLDDFKKINDLLGHNTGDFILKETVSLIKTIIRESDSVFRIGGDEFVILLKNMINTHEIETIAQRLMDITSREIEVDNQKISISLSIGIAISAEEGTAINDLYKKADANLYRAKERGKINIL